MWRRLVEAWAHVRQHAADMWKQVPYSSCAFFALHHHFQLPYGVPVRCSCGIGRQARLQWLSQWRTVATGASLPPVSRNTQIRGRLGQYRPQLQPYIPVLKRDGWDSLAALQAMKADDMAACHIPPGHRVLLKEALGEC